MCQKNFVPQIGVNKILGPKKFKSKQIFLTKKIKDKKLFGSKAMIKLATHSDYIHIEKRFMTDSWQIQKILGKKKFTQKILGFNFLNQIFHRSKLVFTISLPKFFCNKRKWKKNAKYVKKMYKIKKRKEKNAKNANLSKNEKSKK